LLQISIALEVSPAELLQADTELVCDEYIKDILNRFSVQEKTFIYSVLEQYEKLKNSKM